jgi:hypothetical protein
MSEEEIRRGLQINRKKAPDLSHGDELLSLEYRAQIPLSISTSHISIIEYNNFQLQILQVPNQLKNVLRRNPNYEIRHQIPYISR